MVINLLINPWKYIVLIYTSMNKSVICHSNNKGFDPKRNNIEFNLKIVVSTSVKNMKGIDSFSVKLHRKRFSKRVFSHQNPRGFILRFKVEKKNPRFKSLTCLLTGHKNRS